MKNDPLTAPPSNEQVLYVAMCNALQSIQDTCIELYRVQRALNMSTSYDWHEARDALARAEKHIKWMFETMGAKP